MEEVVQLLVDRAVTIAIANVLVLLLTTAIGVFFFTEDFRKDLGFFAAYEAILIVIGLMASADSKKRLGRTLNTGSQQRRSWTENRPTLRKALYLGVLLLMILLNFLALARVISGSGGITGSPFVQLAAALLVLGGVMANDAITQLIIFLFGVAYFLILAETTWLGPRNFDVIMRPYVTSVFLIVTILTLAVAIFTTQRQEAAPTITPKEESS